MLERIAIEQPVYKQIFLDQPSVHGCDQDECAIPKKIGAILYLLATAACLASMGGLYWIYIARTKKLEKRLAEKTRRINRMLAKALMAQIVVIVTFCLFPVVAVITLVLLKIQNASFYSLLIMFIPILYPIADASTMLYFITPYRRFVKDIAKPILRKCGLFRFFKENSELSVTVQPRVIFNNNARLSVFSIPVFFKE